MEGGQASAAQRFMEDLKQLRQMAGRPSYATLERLSRHELRRATMSDVLNGNRVNLPDWRFVHQFVSACRSAMAEDGLDPNEVGTVADWKRHWDSAVGDVIGARFPGHGSQQYGRQELASVPRQAALAPVETTAPSDDVPAEKDVDSAEKLARSSVWGPVPSRLPDFVGRESWLVRLSEALIRDGRVGVVAIQGQFGVGKTQLAIEYANRHADKYDLVWWIPCDDAAAAQAAMGALAARVGVTAVTGEAGDSDYAELFDMLRRRQRFARWLLVFDNVHEPEDIKGLIPPLSGDVLVTTRSNRWGTSCELLELEVFDRAESIEFLRRRMRRFTPGTADRLAEGVGDLPLLLEHAVESRVPVNAYLARLESEPLRLLDEHPADYHATIASVWRTAVDQLRSDAPDAFDLLSRLSFFGTDPVPRESLERSSHLAEISVHDMLSEPIRLALAIGRLRRTGLLRMRQGARSLALHRVTRCVVRDLVARSGTAEGERIRHDVHLLIAAADPLTPDDPATWRSYEELRGHADASGIVACPHEVVRRFVVNLVRYLTAAADLPAAVVMADMALERWEADRTIDSSSLADYRAAMRAAKAGALFAQGRWPEAFQLRQEALAAMRAEPGRWAAEILELEGAAGARCRVTGSFAEALAADQDSARAHTDVFGDDAPQTFHAVNNLIKDMALGGAGADATVAASSVYRNCIAYYGNAGHPAVLAACNVLGRCQWLAGAYREAAGILEDVHSGYDGLAASGMLDENHPWRLIHEIDYAIARRDKGLIAEDLQGFAADMQEVHRRCWRTFGADHPQTLAATVVLASILRRVGGREGEAVRLLGEAERRYPSALPGHPYCHACAGFLATVRCQSMNGSAQWAAVHTVPALQGVVAQLTGSLGETHPLSLTAAGALANALARAGEPDAAVLQSRQALAGFRDVLGPDHPHTLTVEANTAVIQSLLGRGPEPALLSGQLEDLDFTPLPL